MVRLESELIHGRVLEKSIEKPGGRALDVRLRAEVDPASAPSNRSQERVCQTAPEFRHCINLLVDPHDIHCSG